MPIPAALKRMAASMLLTVIAAAALKSPVSRISRSSRGWISPVAGKRKNALVRRQFRWRVGGAVFRQIGRAGTEHKTKASQRSGDQAESANSPLRIATSTPIDQIDQPVAKVEIQFNLRIKTAKGGEDGEQQAVANDGQ